MMLKFMADRLSQPIEGGNLKGFWKFYSCSHIGKADIPVNYMDKYIDMVLKKSLEDKDIIYLRYGDIFIRKLKTIKHFRSYNFGQTVSSINSVIYSKSRGELKLYVYTFTPYMHKTLNKTAMVEWLDMKLKIDLAKNFVILSKIKANWFSGSYSEEIRWMDKSIDYNHITHAIAIALAPCMIGLVKIPPSFVREIQILVKDTTMQDYVTQEAIEHARKLETPLPPPPEMRPDTAVHGEEEPVHEEVIEIPYEENRPKISYKRRHIIQ